MGAESKAELPGCSAGTACADAWQRFSTNLKWAGGTELSASLQLPKSLLVLSGEAMVSHLVFHH